MALPAATWRQLLDNVNKKGDVLAVSQAAGVMAAEQAGALLPTAGVGLGHAQVRGYWGGGGQKRLLLAFSELMDYCARPD